MRRIAPCYHDDNPLVIKTTRATCRVCRGSGKQVKGIRGKPRPCTNCNGQGFVVYQDLEPKHGRKPR